MILIAGFMLRLEIAPRAELNLTAGLFDKFAGFKKRLATRLVVIRWPLIKIYFHNFKIEIYNFTNMFCNLKIDTFETILFNT